MREYLYIPLGGNRKSQLRTYLNLWIVFLLSGLWHGASWSFIAWGAFHGFILTLDKIFWLRMSSKLPNIFQRSFTFLLVLLSWVLFRAESFDAAWDYWIKMFDLGSMFTYGSEVLLVDVLDTRGQFILLLAALLSFCPFFSLTQIKDVFYDKQSDLKIGWSILRTVSSLFLLLVSGFALADSTFNPFIYFRF
jgi:alginate O-acetyltransferase complex protein AlgI